MKTKLIAAMLVIAALSAFGQDWMKGNEPAWVTQSPCAHSDLSDPACLDHRLRLAETSLPKLDPKEISQLLENINVKDDRNGRLDDEELATKSLRLLLKAFPYAN
jgi:hypothetical protein